MKLKNFAVAAALMAASAFASAGTWSVADVTINAIGDQIGSQYDQLTLHGNSGVFGDGTFATLGTLDFVAGPNCTSCDTVNGFLPVALTINGITHTLNLAYTWMGGSTDSITFGSPASELFHFANENVTVLYGVNSGLASDGSFTAHSDVLMAFGASPVAAVPEPASVLMMGTGLGLLGFMSRRKQNKSRAV